MLHQHALKAGAIALAVLGLAITACNKDNDNPVQPPAARSKTFKVYGTGTDAARETGAVTVTENTDSTINVVFVLGKNKKDTVHQVYFIGGNKTAPTTDTLQTKEVKGTGGAVSVDLFRNVKKITLRQAAGATKEIGFKYDDAVAYAAHLKVRHSLFSADTIAIGNFGKAAN